jgi:hypothetical protein
LVDLKVIMLRGEISPGFSMEMEEDGEVLLGDPNEGEIEGIKALPPLMDKLALIVPLTVVPVVAPLGLVVVVVVVVVAVPVAVAVPAAVAVVVPVAAPAAAAPLYS